MSLIAAVASNGVIGADNRLPWRLPEDLKRFRALTIGHSVIMGRKTWDSIGKPLVDRQHIVVSRQTGLFIDGAVVARTLEQALTLATRPDPIFVIGGEEIFRSALAFATQLDLTEIDRHFDGDVRFPPFDRAQWRELSRETHAPAGKDAFTYHFATYERAPPAGAD